MLKGLIYLEGNIEGKWKWYSSYFSGVTYNVVYPDNTYIEFKDNHYVLDEDGTQRVCYFEWRRLPVEWYLDPLCGEVTFIMWDKEKDTGTYYFHSIRNDTLEVISNIFRTFTPNFSKNPNVQRLCFNISNYDKKRIARYDSHWQFRQENY